MKFPFLLLLFAVSSAFGQKSKFNYYIYDKDWKAAKDIASAVYVIQSTNIGDTLFVNRVFNGSGYLWKQESFKDAEQTIPHGQFAWYDDNGRIDSTGYVNNRKKSGKWTFYNDTMGVYLSKEYENGREVRRRDYEKKLIISPEGEKTFDEEKKERDSLAINNMASKSDEKEAAFKGGSIGWRKYLERNLVPPANLVKTGTFRAQFLINKEGKLEHLLVLQSVQLSADIEAIRVLSEMPNWTPAYQNGRNVIYQAIQHITFQVR